MISPMDGHNIHHQPPRTETPEDSPNNCPTPAPDASPGHRHNATTDSGEASAPPLRQAIRHTLPEDPHRMQADSTRTAPEQERTRQSPLAFLPYIIDRSRIRCRTDRQAPTPPGKGTASGRHDTADMAHADRDLQQEPHPNTETSVQSAVLPS